MDSAMTLCLYAALCVLVLLALVLGITEHRLPIRSRIRT